MHDLKMTDQVASSHSTKNHEGHRNPGRENAYGLLFTLQNLNSNLKHHNYELKHPCTRSVLPR